MLKIKKVEPPDVFDAWKKNAKEHTHPLRAFILEHEQHNVCCYCEKKVTAGKEDSHIEHIRPKDTFPKLKNDYANLLVSCQTNGRCGKAKGNKFNQHFIVPTEEDPGEFLTYSINGEIIPIENNKKGSETIKILNLNAPRLIKARRTLFRQVKDMWNSLEDFEEYFHEYPTFICFLKNEYRP